jgi:penicillin-binding protein 2
MILQPVKKRLSSDDDSFIGMRVGVLFLMGLALFVLLAFRLWYLQILSGDDYVGFAVNNRERTVTVEAPRGVIYDRDGEVIVENRAGLSVGLLTMDMPDPEDEEEVAEFNAEISALAGLLGMTTADLLDDYEQAKNDPWVTYVVKEDVPEETVVAYLKERSDEFPGVEVEKTFLRQYPHGALAAHLLGYVGEVSQNDLDQTEFSQLDAGTHIGKDGVERAYDSYLRGTDGLKKVEVNAAGRPIRFTDDVPAETGYNLVLTIDSQLQQEAEQAILEGIKRATEKGLPANAGAVVALDPRSGEVLAMASYPEYDPTDWVGGISEADYKLLSEDPGDPLFNRAISGLYPAASTFKPFVGSVAVNSGVATLDTVVHCPGYFDLTTTNPTQRWDCWVDPPGHGDVRLVDAIEQSCDVYFYTMGSKLYGMPSPVLQNGLRLFGFGRQTGIDLPGETKGSRVPDKVWARENGGEWKPGDEINLAIGQGDLLITPLQEAVALSALVNGGTVWVPRLGLKITDSAGTTINEFTSEKRPDLGIAPAILDEVKRGMRLVTSDHLGTAFDAWWGFPMSVGGKTGTAEVGGKEDYSLFMGYAPADPDKVPEIVVVALIEQGGHGAGVAAPMVRYVMEAYFDIEHAALGRIEGVE